VKTVQYCTRQGACQTVVVPGVDVGEWGPAKPSEQIYRKGFVEVMSSFSVEAHMHAILQSPPPSMQTWPFP
jgi:hypothetical protein